MLFVPLIVLFVTPFVRPLRPGRFLFTYVIPLLPLAIWWDGMVSLLRLYTPPELEALVAHVPGHEAYAWQIGHAREGRGPKLIYLVGVPR
jgi:hypothetical protein